MRIRLGLFSVAAATLMLELLLTRVFDVVLTPNLAYMVIACALFSFGLAGVWLSLRPPTDPVPLPRLCALFAAAMVLLLPVLNWLPRIGIEAEPSHAYVSEPTAGGG